MLGGSLPGYRLRHSFSEAVGEPCEKRIADLQMIFDGMLGQKQQEPQQIHNKMNVPGHKKTW